METSIHETERLILRPFDDGDATALHRILNQEKILQYFPDPGSPTLERARRFVDHQIEQWRHVGYGWWAVEEKESGKLLGWNGLQYLPETEETEIGFLIDKDYWGRGLTTEAGRFALRFGFEGLNLQEIVALAHPENGGSQRVIEKLGLRFVEEAIYFGMAVRRYALDAEGYRRDASRS